MISKFSTAKPMLFQIYLETMRFTRARITFAFLLIRPNRKTTNMIHSHSGCARLVDWLQVSTCLLRVRLARTLRNDWADSLSGNGLIWMCKKEERILIGFWEEGCETSEIWCSCFRGRIRCQQIMDLRRSRILHYQSFKLLISPITGNLHHGLTNLFVIIADLTELKNKFWRSEWLLGREILPTGFWGGACLWFNKFGGKRPL